MRSVYPRGGLPRGAIWTVVLFALTSPELVAQCCVNEGGTDVGEASVYTGVGFGPLSFHPVVGGSSGISATKYAILLIDANYMPIGGRILAQRPGIITAHSGLFDFNFSGHIRIPLKKRWTPYGILGAALLYNRYQRQFIRPSGILYFSGQSDCRFGFETGAGLRYYVGDQWGVRGEYRYTVSTQNFSRILAGVFYQFEGAWPFAKGGRNTRRPMY
jgi:opacity protein-like surface antigen